MGDHMVSQISKGNRIAKAGIATLLVSVWPAHPASAQLFTEHLNRGLVEVVTGTSDGTAVRMAEDLANLLDDSTRRVLPVIGKGSLQNLADLKALRGVDMAVVQTDVLDRLKAQKSDESISYIAKLYNDEFHLLVRSEINSPDDLAGKKVNVGTAGDGTSVTAPAIFGLLGIKVEVTSYFPSLALEKLRSGEIAAMACVTAKPAPLFSALRQRDGFHLLAIPLTKEVLASSYTPAKITAEDYPGLVPSSEPIDTVSVGTALMVANLMPGSERSRNVASFVEAFFTQFSHLEEPGHHPKWQEVNISAELPGWKRYPPAETWLKRYLVASHSTAGSGSSIDERELREIFSKFLDERSRLAGSSTMSRQEKDRMFDEFRRWQSALPH
jgi:uncharacterized protein